jgi:transcriptional regulator with XRE-family HTH domain
MKSELRRIRKAMGLRMIDLAVKAGVGVSTVWQLENGYGGRATEDTKRKIASGLCLRVEDVFPESKAPKSA